MRKILATIRKHLHGDRAAILQGVTLARQHPALHPVLGAGLTMHPGGAVTWTKDSEVARRSLVAHRPFAALQLYLMTEAPVHPPVRIVGEGKICSTLELSVEHVLDDGDDVIDFCIIPQKGGISEVSA